MAVSRATIRAALNAAPAPTAPIVPVDQFTDAQLNAILAAAAVVNGQGSHGYTAAQGIDLLSRAANHYAVTHTSPFGSYIGDHTVVGAPQVCARQTLALACRTVGSTRKLVRTFATEIYNWFRRTGTWPPNYAKAGFLPTEKYVAFAGADAIDPERAIPPLTPAELLSIDANKVSSLYRAASKPQVATTRTEVTGGRTAVAVIPPAIPRQ